VNVENSEEVIEGLEFVLVELPKFVPETANEKRMRVLWLRFLREVGENVDRIDPALLEDEHLKEAVEICEIAAYTPGELEAYDSFWDIVSKERTLSDALAEKNKALAEKDRALAEKDNTISEKDKALAEKDKALAEKDKALAEKDNTISEKDKALAETAQALAEKDKVLAENQKLIESLQKQLEIIRK